MTAYHQGMTQKVTCRLIACTPGSAPGPVVTSMGGLYLYLLAYY